VTVSQPLSSQASTSLTSTTSALKSSSGHDSSRPYLDIKEEVSYRKQIAHQLRTQYVEGIYDNPVTLKSRLTVTQGHWK